MLSIIVGIVLGYLIYYKIFKPMGIWADLGITYERPWPLVGNMGRTFIRQKHQFHVIHDLYKKHTSDRYIGFFQFTKPILIIQDVELVKQVCVKEFDSFRDHMDVFNINTEEVLTKSLIRLNGDEWRQMRATLSPAFTSSKMKNMYLLMVECAQNFCKNFQNKGNVDLDVKDAFSKFATNVIASTAFGIQIDCIKEPNHEFYLMGQTVTNFTASKISKLFLGLISPTLAKILNMRIVDENTESFFKNIILNNIRERKEKKIVRHDLIHLLMEAQKGTLKHEETQEKKEGFATVEESHIGQNTNKMVLTDDHLVAQAILFFFAGFETISTMSSFMAYELAISLDVQKKLQQEIDLVSEKFPNEVPYETLMSMKYLDQVVSETLRKWPPAFLTDRQCNRDFEIVPEKVHERKVVIKNGMVVGIPIVGFHYDPKYYPNPERFDPERFSDEHKSKIVSGTYMPFGVGPRNCIGSRFALLEMKTLFYYLLSKFDIVPNNKTDIPLVISPKKLNLLPEKGFQLTLKLRKH